MTQVFTFLSVGFLPIMSAIIIGLSLIHISEPTRQAEISYAVFCLKKKTFSYTHLRAHETGRNLVCRLLLDKKKKKHRKTGETIYTPSMYE